LTFADAIAEIARASGREIRYVQVSLDEYVGALEQAQLPPEFVALIRYLFTEVLDGRNAYLTVCSGRSGGPREISRSMRGAQPRAVRGRYEEKKRPLPGREGARWQRYRRNQFQLFRVRNSRTSRSASSRFQP